LRLQTGTSPAADFSASLRPAPKGLVIAGWTRDDLGSPALERRTTMLNQVQLIGFLGADPEVRSLNDGARAAHLRLATTETWRDRDTREKREKTEWHRITVWGESTVKFLEDYAAKGSLLYIEGKLQTRKWQDQSGQDRYSTEIMVQQRSGQVKILRDGAGEPEEEAQPQEQAQSSRNRSRGRRQAQPREELSADLDDGAPF
jgi:single-strand DNA-binding protein